MKNDTPLTDEQRKIVDENKGLAYRMAGLMARKYPGMDPEDIQAACLYGLCRAVRKWRPESGALSTAAWYWMRQTTQRDFEEAHLIRVPERLLRGMRARQGTPDEQKTPEEAAADRVRGMQRVLNGLEGETGGVNLVADHRPWPGHAIEIDDEIAAAGNRVTDAEMRALRLVADGWSPSEVARREGVSPQAISGRFGRVLERPLKAPRPNREKKSDAIVDEALRLSREGVPDKEIARRLGVSASTIVRRLGRLSDRVAPDDPRRRHIGMTGTEIDAIRRMAAEGKPIREIARRLGVNRSTVRRRAGLSEEVRPDYRRVPHRPNTPDTTLEAIRAMRAEGLPDYEIERRTGVTRKTIRRHCGNRSQQKAS